MSPTEQLRRENLQKIRIMRKVLAAGLLLTAAKFTAYWLTFSNAILTDAFESIINIVAASFGLYSLVYASRPKDEDHPYGHGKVEYLAVGLEGGLIFFAGGGMIVKALYSFFHPVPLARLDLGLWITLGTSLVNFLLGRYLVRTGKRLHSSTLVADGHHLLSDTWSSVGLVVGLGLMILTGKAWLDTALTILLGTYILVIGSRLVKDSLSGLMDEADFATLESITEVLNKERKDRWIDIHNLRVVKYGAHIHIDAHLTLPFYDELESAHRQLKELEHTVNGHFSNRVEFFIHTDPCRPVNCPVCTVDECAFRKSPFSKRLNWDVALLSKNQPHGA